MLNMKFSIKVKMFLLLHAIAHLVYHCKNSAASFIYLGLYHPLWNIVHGIWKPTFKAFCKIANGLGQGTCIGE